MKRTSFTITVLNWEKYNKHHKRSFKATLIDNRFCSDAKLMQVPTSYRWTFLGLLLYCGDASNHEVTLSIASLRLLTGSGIAPTKVLDALQELQLLTYVKNDSLMNRNEIKRKEMNRIEGKGNEMNGEIEISSSAKPNPPKKITDHKFHELIEIWNSNCGKLPSVVKSSSSRNIKCQKIFKNLTSDEWGEVVRRMALSDFCCGKNDRSWIATFDFLLKPETHMKVLEGKYDNRTNNFGKTEDGRYLTNTVKRSHNNKIMIEKYLNLNGEQNEQLKDVGSDKSDS